MQDFLYYPMLITQEKDIYKATFPDFKNIEVIGKNYEAVINKGKEAVAQYVYELQDKTAIPQATDLKDIEPKENEILVMADINMLLFTFSYKPKTVTRAITLPEGLNELAKQSGMNVSLVTQQAIKKYLGIKED